MQNRWLVPAGVKSMQYFDSLGFLYGDAPLKLIWKAKGRAAFVEFVLNAIYE